MPSLMQSCVLFRLLRLLIAQAGFVPVAICLIFENCYKKRFPARNGAFFPFRVFAFCFLMWYVTQLQKISPFRGILIPSQDKHF